MGDKMNREESAKIAELFKAHAEGKSFEGLVSGKWYAGVPTEICLACTPHLWRIAPELPPKPSQEWLDKHGVELTGEFRIPVNGEIWVSENNDEALHLPSGGEVPPYYGIGARWILRKRAPAVNPWTIETVPMPLVLKRKYDSTLWVVVSARTDGVLTCGTHDDSLGFNTQANASIMRHSWKWLMDKFTHRDGSPCGEVSK